MSETAVKVLDDPAEAMRARGKNPELAAFLAWLIPGAGHLYAGYRVKGAGGLVFILGLFVSGLLLSGGEAVSLESSPGREVGHPYAFLAQVGVGLPTGIGLLYSHNKLPGLKLTRPTDFSDPDYARRHPDRDTGLLFTMIAGLLNLLLIHDALSGVPGAVSRRADERRRRQRLDKLRAEVLAERAKEQVAQAEEEAKAETEPDASGEAKTEAKPDAEAKADAKPEVAEAKTPDAPADGDAAPAEESA